MPYKHRANRQKSAKRKQSRKNLETAFIALGEERRERFNQPNDLRGTRIPGCSDYEIRTEIEYIHAQGISTVRMCVEKPREVHSCELKIGKGGHMRYVLRRVEEGGGITNPQTKNTFKELYEIPGVEGAKDARRELDAIRQAIAKDKSSIEDYLGVKVRR